MKSWIKFGGERLGEVGSEYASQGLSVIKAFKYLIYTLIGLAILGTLGGVGYAVMA